VIKLLFFFQAIPELTGMIALSLALAEVPLRWGRTLAAGTILAVIIFFIRSLPLPFGLHTISLVLLTVIFITNFTHIPPTQSFMVVLISTIILGFLELVIHRSFFFLTKIEPSHFVSNTLLWTMLGLPQAIIMIFLALITPRFKKPVQGSWKL